MADLAQDMDSLWVSLALKPPYLRGGIDLKPLPPRLWEAARIQLQQRFRDAIGDETAILAHVEAHDAELALRTQPTNAGNDGGGR